MSGAFQGQQHEVVGPLVFLGFGKAAGALPLRDPPREGGLRVPGWSDLRFEPPLSHPWEQR